MRVYRLRSTVWIYMNKQRQKPLLPDLTHCYLFVVFTGLISYCTGSLACRLARSLTLSASAFFHGFLQALCIQSLYMFHFQHPPSLIPNCAFILHTQLLFDDYNILLSIFKVFFCSFLLIPTPSCSCRFQPILQQTVPCTRQGAASHRLLWRQPKGSILLAYTYVKQSTVRDMVSSAFRPVFRRPYTEPMW